MRVCVCVSMCVHVCVLRNVCMCVCVFNVCLCVCVHKHKHMYVHVCVCSLVWVFMCKHVSLYVCMYTCVYACARVHICHTGLLTHPQGLVSRSYCLHVHNCSSSPLALPLSHLPSARSQLPCISLQCSVGPGSSVLPVLTQ